jgi:sulfate permease, SulP family
VGSTSVNISAGAKSRWASIFSGIFIIIIILALSQVINLVPMPTMAAILIVAASQSFNPGRINDVWVNSMASRLFMLATFIGTLFLPIQYAVLLGIALSSIHYIFKSAGDIRIIELVIQKDGSLFEQTAAKKLTGDSVTLMTIYGSLFYASAYKLQEKLPSARNVKRAVVIIRLHGFTDAGSTFFAVLNRYADELREGGGKLILSGVSDTLKKQLERSASSVSVKNIYPAAEKLRASTMDAVDEANKWLEQKSKPHKE